ncbi:MAG: porin family protein [Dysgonomonas sp.]|nr:porin family protein [Dysgonomonas sp.]
MKKKTWYLVILFFVGLPIYAQLGVKGGLNISSVRNDGYDNSYNLGFNIGGFYDVHLSKKFYFQPQLLFLYEPYSRELPEMNNDKVIYKDKSNSFSLSIPVLFSYRYPIKDNQKISVDMGPFLSFGLFGEIEAKLWENNILTENYTTDLYTDIRDILDAGLMGGVSYEYEQFILSGHIKYGLTRVTSYDKTISYLISVGYKFKK